MSRTMPPDVGEIRDGSDGFPWRCIAVFQDTHLAAMPIGTKVYAAPDVARLLREAEAYKWGYEYLQDRMESIGRHGWAHDCDGEIEYRINTEPPRAA